MENFEGESAPQQGGSSMFKMASIVVILGILLLGGLYFWGYMEDGEDADMNDADSLFDDGLGNFLPIGDDEDTESALDEVLEDVKDDAAEALGQQGTSDAVADIEADLEATNLDDLDVDLSDLGF